MKLFSVIDQGFYAGCRMAENQEQDLIDLHPTGLILDKTHCPKLITNKKTGERSWIDDSSAEAAAMSAKHFPPAAGAA